MLHLSLILHLSFAQSPVLDRFLVRSSSLIVSSFTHHLWSSLISPFTRISWSVQRSSLISSSHICLLRPVSPSLFKHEHKLDLCDEQSFYLSHNHITSIWNCRFEAAEKECTFILNFLSVRYLLLLRVSDFTNLNFNYCIKPFEWAAMQACAIDVIVDDSSDKIHFFLDHKFP